MRYVSRETRKSIIQARTNVDRGVTIVRPLWRAETEHPGIFLEGTIRAEARAGYLPGRLRTRSTLWTRRRSCAVAWNRHRDGPRKGASGRERRPFSEVRSPSIRASSPIWPDTACGSEMRVLIDSLLFQVGVDVRPQLVSARGCRFGLQDRTPLL